MMIAFYVWLIGAIGTLIWLLWQNKHDLFTSPVRPSGFFVLFVLSAVWWAYLPVSWFVPKD